MHSKVDIVLTILGIRVEKSKNTELNALKKNYTVNYGRDPLDRDETNHLVYARVNCKANVTFLKCYSHFESSK